MKLRSNHLPSINILQLQVDLAQFLEQGPQYIADDEYQSLFE